MKVTDGSCNGTQYGVFTCSGENNVKIYIKWVLDIGKGDFEIKSKFKVDLIGDTGIRFMLSSGPTNLILGLDGDENKLFYATKRSGSMTDGPNYLGPTNLNPDKFQTIVIIRKEGKLKVSVDGEAWADISFSKSINAIGWRPWKNTIHIKDLVQIVDKGNIIIMI